MTHASIEDAVNALYQAMLAHDTRALDALLADDVIYIHSPGFAEAKIDFLNGVRDGLYVYERVRPTAQRITQSGDLAVVHDTLDFQGGPRGVDHPPVRLITTLVWSRQQGAWRLQLRHATRMP